MVNESFFEVIDTEAKAYLLGLIASDGCVRKNNNNGHYLSLSLIDEDHIQKVADLLEWKGKIFYRPPQAKPFYGKLYNCRASWRLMIGSKKIVNDIFGHGVGFNKSEELSLPKLDKNLVRHFIRGFFDGDGCITFSKIYKNWKTGYPYWNIIGLETILLEIQQILVDSCNVFKGKLIKEKRVRKGNIYVLCYNGMSAVSIRDFMYDGASIYLTRKKDKFFSIEVPYTYTGYTVKEYCEKYGFNSKAIFSWTKKGVLKCHSEWDTIIIPIEEGDAHAAYLANTVSLADAAQLLDLTSDKLYYLIQRGTIKSCGKKRMHNRIDKLEIENFLTREQRDQKSLNRH